MARGVTHNPDGEYGNYQHKQINKMIQELGVDNLYYFGKYYDVKQLEKLDKETTLDGNYIKQKISMLKNYDLYDDYKHILPFEDWMRDNEWKS